MNSSVKPVTVQILDKEYRIACPEEEKSSLLSSAKYLNSKMKEARDTGKVIGVDRIAVMTALNITHELLQQKDESMDLSHSISSRLQLLQGKVDAALGQCRQVSL